MKACVQACHDCEKVCRQMADERRLIGGYSNRGGHRVDRVCPPDDGPIHFGSTQEHQGHAPEPEQQHHYGCRARRAICCSCRSSGRKRGRERRTPGTRRYPTRLPGVSHARCFGAAGPSWNVSPKLTSTVRKIAVHRGGGRQPGCRILGAKPEHPEDLRLGNDRHERPHQTGRLEQCHAHGRESKAHERTRLLDPVASIERIDDYQEQARCAPERDQRATDSKASGGAF